MFKNKSEDLIMIICDVGLFARGSLVHFDQVLEDSLLIDKLEYVRSVEQDVGRAEYSHQKECVQLKTVYDQGNVFPVVADLYTQKTHQYIKLFEFNLEFYFFVVVLALDMIRNERNLISCLQNLGTEFERTIVLVGRRVVRVAIIL